MFEHSQKKAQRQLTNARLRPLLPVTTAHPHAAFKQLQLEHALTIFTSRPITAQNQAAAPVLQAATLQREEEKRVHTTLPQLKRQINKLRKHLPENALEQAIQRQTHLTPPTRPQSAADWVTVMRHQAQQVSGQTLHAQQLQQFLGLQSQVAHTLAKEFKQDRQSPEARYAQYGTHLSQLLEHPLSSKVAGAVMSFVPAMERPALQRAVDAATAQAALQRQQDEKAFELQGLQRQLAQLEMQRTQPVLQRIQARRGRGNPLPKAIQRHLEQGLNYDLSKVRIHNDPEADKLAKSMNALAFTTGTDIYFQNGKFNPNTQTGLELLAHEVTHTVQQSKGQVSRGIDPDIGLEIEARTVGAKLARKPITKPKATFGTHSKRLGQNTTPRQSLQRAMSTQTPGAIQRWGLGDLKKAAQKRLIAVARVVATTTHRAAQKVQQVKNAVKSKATQVIKASQNRVTALRKQVQKAVAKLKKSSGQRLLNARKTLKKIQGQITRKATEVNRKVQLQINTLRMKTQRIIGGVRKAVVKNYKSIKNQATHLAKAGSRAIQNSWNTTRAAARTTFNRLKTAGTNTLKIVKNRSKTALNQGRKIIQKTLQTAKTAYQSSKRRATATLTRTFRNTTKGASQLLKTRPLLALLATGGTIATGYNAIKSLKKGGLKQLGQDIKSKAVAAWKWLKSPEGLSTIARIGVTAAIGVGAAALTVATGGVAAPLLIMAAGGALGGAAGKLTQNAILKKFGDKKKYGQLKYTQGITPGTLAGDAVLGAALGPAGALAGGVARQALGNVGRYALAPTGRLLGAAGKAMKSGILKLKGVRPTTATTFRQIGRDDRQRFLRTSFAERSRLLLDDIKQYNSILWAETRNDIKDSIRGSLGVAGKSLNPAQVLGGRSQLRAARLQAADKQLRFSSEVWPLANELGISTRLPYDEVRRQVVQKLAQSNHPLVRSTVARDMARKVKSDAWQDVKKHWLGDPRRQGESVGRRVLRGVGNLATVGIRTNFNNVKEKDAQLAQQLAKGGLGKASLHLAGATTGEVAKMNLMSLLRSGRWVQDHPLKQAREGLIQAFGGTPDMFKDKALGSLLGMDAAPKSVLSSLNAGSIETGAQFEDGEAKVGE